MEKKKKLGDEIRCLECKRRMKKETSRHRICDKCKPLRKKKQITKWRKRNKEHIRDEAAKYRDENREHLREYNRIYQRRRRANLPTLEEQILKEMEELKKEGKD